MKEGTPSLIRGRV